MKNLNILKILKIWKEKKSLNERKWLDKEKILLKLVQKEIKRLKRIRIKNFMYVL